VADWIEMSFGDLTENFDSHRVPVKESNRESGPYPYYGASGIVDYVSDYIFEGEYLLIAEDGENLRSRRTPFAFLADGRFWVNNHAHIVRGNSLADTKFLLYALLNTDISGFLTGSTIPKLTQGNMNRIPILTPSLHEQRAIAGFLGNLDKNIEINRQMNQTLESFARAIFKSWFIGFDPVRAKMQGRKPLGMDAETAALFPDSFEDSEIGKIPKGWKVGEVKDFYTIRGGTTPKTDTAEFWGGSHPFATPKDMASLRSSVLLRTERMISDEGLSRIGSGLIPKGSFLLSSRAPIGYLAISENRVAINQGIIAAIPNCWLSSRYLLSWCAANMSTIEAAANGTTFLEISKSSFKKLRLIAPPENIGRKYDATVSAFYEKIIANAKENETLSEIRDLLLPKLTSGQIRLDRESAFNSMTHIQTRRLDDHEQNEDS